MGYYTDFHLYISVEDAGIIEPLEAEIKRMNIFEYGSVDEDYFCCAKWYEHDKDTLLLSTRFPNVLFALEGYGEEREDFWLNYYKDGRIMGSCIELIRHSFCEDGLLDGGLKDTGQLYSYELPKSESTPPTSDEPFSFDEQAFHNLIANKPADSG